jgi:hypothetical protein
MLTVNPPSVRARTGSRIHYTLHNNDKTFALKAIKEDDKTTLVAFKRLGDAMRMGHMIERHVFLHKEWPELSINNTMQLQIEKGKNILDPLSFIVIQEHTLDNLANICASKYMDMLEVQRMISNKNGYTLTGNRIKIDAKHDFYVNVFNKMFED